MKENNSIHFDIAKGFSVLIFREFIIKVFSFFGQLILTRILFPSEFGLFVIISFVINFLALFSDVGLTSAIIQKHEKPSQEEIAIILYVKIILSIFLIICIWILAPYCQYVGIPASSSTTWMIRIFSLSMLSMSIRSVPTALLERDIAYHIISITDVLGVVAYQIIVIVLALMGFSTWSIIYAILAKEIIECAVIFQFQKIQLRPVFNLSKVSPMLRFGVYMQGSGIVNYLYGSVVPAIGSITSGTSAVGILNFSSSLSSVPESIATNFGRVAFANFSKIQKNTTALRDAIEKSIGVLSIITLFFTLLVLGFGKELVSILYVQKWQAAVVPLYWFTASTFFISVTYAVSQGILVVGRSKNVFYIIVTTTVLEWVTAYILTYLFGFTGIAIAMTVVSVISFVAYSYEANKIGLLPDLRIQILPKLVVIGVLLMISNILNNVLPQSIIFLSVKILSISALYAASMYLVARDDFDQCRLLVQSEIQKIKI